MSPDPMLAPFSGPHLHLVAAVASRMQALGLTPAEVLSRYQAHMQALVAAAQTLPDPAAAAGTPGRPAAPSGPTCPHCGTRLGLVANHDGLRILGCRKCRYSTIIA
jgi:1,6-anhydro-N-acetylmuramate kinase